MKHKHKQQQCWKKQAVTGQHTGLRDQIGQHDPAHELSSRESCY